MNFVIRYINELFRLTNEMSPYLLFGLFIAGLLHVYFEKERTIKYLGKNNLKSVIYASLLGVPLPLCSCGVIPTGIAFYKEGASKGATVSFLISTPQTGVDSIAVTWSMMNLPFALLRPIIAFLTGILGGLLSNRLNHNAELQNSSETDTCQGDCDVKKREGKLKSLFRYAFVEFLEDIAKWLVIGLLIATAISVLLPDDFFTMYLDNKILSMLIVLSASVPLYICATGSVPIAVALMAKGLSPGAALVLLMAGPATNAATIAVLTKVLGRKTVLIYLFSIISGALLFGVIIDYVLPSSWFILNHTMMHHHHGGMFSSWFNYASTIILSILLIYVFIKPYLKPKSMNFTLNIPEIQIVRIDGMTCNHCKMNVEKGISTIEGVENVEVDLSQKTATIKGKNVSLDSVKNLIESRGYTYVGLL